jgi:peptidyl-prolyl isomerase D
MRVGEMGGRHHLKGATFYRIIDRFIDQTGVHTSGGALGGTFKDDAKGLKLKHDRKVGHTRAMP